MATISVPAVLAVYDWPKDTDRYQRLVRVVDYLFDRFEKLQKEPGYHEKWKDVNLAAKVPGWQRFKPLQDRLDKVATAAPRAHRSGTAARPGSARGAERSERAGASVQAVPRMEQEAEPAVTAGS